MEELTELELACLRMARLRNREIAERVHVSVKTVERCLSSAYRKLGSRNRVDAVIRALGKGILQLEEFWGPED